MCPLTAGLQRRLRGMEGSSSGSECGSKDMAANPGGQQVRKDDRGCHSGAALPVGARSSPPRKRVCQQRETAQLPVTRKQGSEGPTLLYRLQRAPEAETPAGNNNNNNVTRA